MQFNAKLLVPLLQTEANDGSLQKKDLRRMRDYPVQFIAFFADLMGILRGQPLQELERKRITYFAAFLCLYDDFLDEATLDDQALWRLYKHPEQFLASNTKEQTAVMLLRELYQIFLARGSFDQIFQKFYQAQLESRQQFTSKHLNREQIRQISFDKGGYALLLSRLLMDHPLDTAEQEAVYQLGAWFQILDDILDIAVDRENGILSLATSVRDVQVLIEDLSRQTREVFASFRALPYPAGLTESVLFLLFLIGTSGKIHLHRLRGLQGSKPRFELDQYTKEEILWRENRFSNYWIGLWYILKDQY